MEKEKNQYNTKTLCTHIHARTPPGKKDQNPRDKEKMMGGEKKKGGWLVTAIQARQKEKPEKKRKKYIESTLCLSRLQ